MAGFGFIALLDDIASMMDKVAVMAKANMGAMSSVADKTGQALGKTAGVVGDDIALGTEVLRVGDMEQRIGLMAKRELAIVWAVAKGSAVNKVWLSILALGLSASSPGLLHALLALGGAYLSMEGAQKVMSAMGWGHEDAEVEHLGAKSEPVHQVLTGKALAKFEKDKIKGAVRTDMVLSGEIILISLGYFSTYSLAGQALGLFAIGLAMTAGVYLSVAALVKLDDVGLWMFKKGHEEKTPWMIGMGGRLMVCMPVVMKCLTVLGVCAMLGVGGGILCKSVPGGEGLLAWAAHWPWVGVIYETALSAAVGLVAGVVLELVLGLAPVQSVMSRAKRGIGTLKGIIRRRTGLG
jgi:predicted DNA repair protein MutK